MLDSNITNALSLLSSLITVIGLPIAIWQAWGASKSSRAAKLATDQLQSSIDAVDHSYVTAQLANLRMMVASGDYKHGMLFFDAIKRPIRKYVKRRRIRNPDSATLSRAIDVVEHQISNGSSGQHVNFSALNSSISTIMELVSGWEVEEGRINRK